MDNSVSLRLRAVKVKKKRVAVGVWTYNGQSGTLLWKAE